MIIGWSVILSECFVVHRTVIIPARQQSSTLRMTGEDADQPVAAEVTAPQYFVDFDGYYWVTYARKMVSEGDLRVHWTNRDNAPFGRGVHWSSLFSWWLVVLGAFHSVFSGLPINSAIGFAAYYANPVLMGLMLLGVGWTTYRRLGNLAASVLVMILALQPALLRDFGYGRPDHHGLHLICALGFVLLAVLGGGGWVRRDDDARLSRGKGKPAVADIDDGFALDFLQARRWFIASGIFGGCGLWIGATQQALVIGAVGVGAFAAMIGATRRVSASGGEPPSAESEPTLRWAPELWRLWSRVGALTSFLAYVVETFPNDFGMSLEVNHPLFALAWLCAGEILYCIGTRRLEGTPLTEYPIAKLGLMVAGIVLLPVLAFLGPADWYLIRDPLMLRVHSVIGEFKPLFSEVQNHWSLAKELAPVLLVLVGISFLLWSRTQRFLSTLLAVSLVPSICLGVMFLVQVRWGGLFLVVTCVVVVPLLFVVQRNGLKSARSRVGALILLVAVGLQLVPNAAWAISRVGTAAGGNSYMPLAEEVFARDLALVMGAASDHGPRPFSVMTGLGEGSRIHFFGPARASGSLYWDNLDGVRDMVDFFADYGEEEALRIARNREIEYIIVTPDTVSMVQMLKYGNNDLEGTKKTLAYRLMISGSNVPAWCRPFRVKGFRWAENCRIYRVTGLVAKPGE